MKKIALAVAAGALLAATQANAGTFPVNNLTGAETGLVDTVAVRVYSYGGNRYCFYFNGWRGPGWYRCGFANRRGFGWGGVYGWNGWTYGPYERRYHSSVHRGERFGYGEEHERRGRAGAETRTRTRATTGSGIETRGRTRTTTGSGVETHMNRSTTGRGSGMEMREHGGAKVQGGAGGNVRGGASVKGGGTVGGGAGGGQGEKRQQQ